MRISLTSLAGSSCTESIVASVADLDWLEQFPGHGLDFCGSGRLVPVEAAEGVGVTFTEDSLRGWLDLELVEASH